MAPEAATGIPEDLEHLRRRFEEFRNTRVGRSPLPEALWAAASMGITAVGTTFRARTLPAFIDSWRHQPVQRTIGSTAHIRRDREDRAASSRMARLSEA